jgi:hypothetical protein
MDILDDELQERVLSFSARGREVDVRFELSAAIYRLPADREDFVEQVANLAAAWQSGKPAHVTVRGTEIVAVADTNA